jgi:hypothetical protein
MTMKTFKRAATAMALSGLAFSAMAMSAVLQDHELRQISGQDGVSMAGDLNINLGSFTYTDTDANGGSVSFNDVGIKGMFVMTIDILDSGEISSSMLQSMKKYLGSYSTALHESLKILPNSVDNPLGAGIYDGESDVVQFAFPNANLDGRLTSSISVGSINMGHSTASFGAFAINNINMQGTKIWVWAH